MNIAYEFNTPLQAQLAEYHSAAYMEYINGQNLSVKESDVGFDLNGNGDLEDTIALTIEYDMNATPRQMATTAVILTCIWLSLPKIPVVS